MTSQKRYRHQKDGNNSNTRFRDLPPRFKRQKSSSQPRSQSPDTHISGIDTQDTDPSQSVPTVVSATMAPSISNVYHSEEQLMGQMSSQADSVQTPRAAMLNVIPHSQSSMLNLSPSVAMTGLATHPTAVMSGLATHPSALSNPAIHHHAIMSSPATWKWQQKNDSVPTSSPWNNTYARLDFQQPPNIPLGTHFGYRMNNSPLSPWASREDTHFAGQHGITERSIWASDVANSYAGQRNNYSLGYSGSVENGLASQHFVSQQNPGGIWGMPASHFKHYPPASSQINSSASPLPIKPAEKLYNSKVLDNSIRERVNEKGNDTRTVDNRDPDIKTIEMLRELERVADQKENENDGTDRKSLVSHHLRMLMCAVDRYTEGIEDELPMMPRSDEAKSSPNSRGSTPIAPPDFSKTLAHNPTVGNPESHTSIQSPTLRAPHVSAAKICTGASYQDPFSASLPYPHSGDLKRTGQETAAWNLWSSPTFDFRGVLKNQTAGSSKIKDEGERKPLYQRQPHNF